MVPDADTRDLVSHDPSRVAAIPGAIAVFSADRPLLAAIPLPAGAGELGRDDDRGITDDRVSRKHASIARANGVWTLTDHGSRNGTFANGTRVTGTVAVDPPRVVRLAYTIYTLVDDVAPFTTATVAIDGDRVIGPAFAATLAQVRAVTGDSLLLAGETGVGKELVAREYHAATGGGPFISVNCAAIPEGVAERLLFGSVKGAFTGATDAPGYLAAADGGVLFLDEIGELEPAVQAKLLRAIETREVVPLGAASGKRVTIRLCFASSRSLRAAMTDSGFRPDLYYRIAQPEIRVPALRERREDIPWLVTHELAMVSAAAPIALSAHPRLIEACLLRPWPGNIRELRAAIRAAATRVPTDERVVRPEMLDADAGRPVAAPPAAAGAPIPGAARPDDITKDQVTAAIAASAGNLAAAARSLGLHRSQLYRLLERYGLSR